MEDMDWEAIINRVLDLIEKCIENRSDEEIVLELRNPRRRTALAVAMAGRGGFRQRLAAYRALVEEAALLSDEDALLLIEVAREKA